jgi:predicted transcriptional regulator
MDLEDIFSSRLRMKTLKLLDKMHELNVSEIAHRLGVNYGVATKHLKVLEAEGMIQQKMFGRIRLYRLNENSPKTKAVRNLIEVWEHANRQ